MPSKEVIMKRGCMGRDKDGDNEGTIEQAFLKYEMGIKSFISRFVRGSHNIEDISQETFMRAFKAEKQTNINNPRSFLFRTAKNVALNHLTKKSNKLTDYIEEKSSFDVIDCVKPIDEQIDDKERFRLFCRALSTLPPQCQRVFVMRKVFGYSQKEISKALNISQSTVEKHIAAGLRRSRDYMIKNAPEQTAISIHKDRQDSV